VLIGGLQALAFSSVINHVDSDEEIEIVRNGKVKLVARELYLRRGSTSDVSSPS
jgi:hypothetical protein